MMTAKGRLWHVTLTVSGDPRDPADVRAALGRLAAEQPFLLSGRYAGNCAELQYWEEAESCSDACALALRLWGEHRATAQLPAWEVVGLEVVERSLNDRRTDGVLLAAAPVQPVTSVTPLPRWRPQR